MCIVYSHVKTLCVGHLLAGSAHTAHMAICVLCVEADITWPLAEKETLTHTPSDFTCIITIHVHFVYCKNSQTRLSECHLYASSFYRVYHKRHRLSRILTKFIWILATFDLCPHIHNAMLLLFFFFFYSSTGTLTGNDSYIHKRIPLTYACDHDPFTKLVSAIQQQ